MYFSSRFTRDDLTNTSFDFNTYDDWFLIPTSRPVIQPPKPKQQVVDVPGANGLTDLSRSLTGYPVFQNRQGTNEYMIENDKWPKWLDALTEISNKLSGQELRMYFVDEEPEYYYIGSWTVSNWQTGDIYSTITIEYDLYPYKMKDHFSGYDQPWDTFNFNKDYIMMSTGGTYAMFEVDLDSEHTGGTLFYNRDLRVCNDCVGLFGEMPTYPQITVRPKQGTNSWRILLTFDNKELGISSAEKVLEGTAGVDEVEIPEFVMTMMNPRVPENEYFPWQSLRLQVTRLEGDVTVRVGFRVGRL